jgi:hypothetical protein
VTLRLSEGLKSRIEAKAASEGVSVNTWLVHAARQAVESRGSSTGSSAFLTGRGRRITGYAQS